MIHWICFLVLSFFVLACSFGVVLHKNPVVSAVFLVMDLFFIAGLYALQEAHFVSALQILIYAGAIVVLFLFVIMLLNLDENSKSLFSRKKSIFFFISLGVCFFGFLTSAFLSIENAPIVAQDLVTSDDHVFSLAKILFVNYLWPFELVSFVILLSVVAAILIAKKERVSQ